MQRLIRIVLAVAIAIAMPPAADDVATGLAELQTMPGDCCKPSCACGPVNSCGCALTPPDEQQPRPALPAARASRPTASDRGQLLADQPLHLVGCVLEPVPALVPGGAAGSNAALRPALVLRV